jgi:hypothetical protein
MAITGTASRRQTMAITMPIIAPGLKPSLRELALGREVMAGGASGMEEGMGVGAIVLASKDAFDGIDVVRRSR